MTSLIEGAFKIGGALISGHQKTKASKKAQAVMDAAVDKSVTSTKDAQSLELQNLEPYREAGRVGLDKLAGGVTDGHLTKTFGLSDFAEDPGYQFRLQEGQRQVDRAANAAGSEFSGRQLRAMEEYGQGLGSTEYGAARTRFNEDRDQEYNKLVSLSDLGYRATGSANSAIDNGNTNLVNLYTGGASFDANSMLQRGNIRAATTTSVFDSLGTMASDAASAALPGGGSLAALFKKGK